MVTTLKIFFVIIDLIFLVTIINLLKKKRLNIRNTLTWLFATLAILIAALFPEIITKLTKIVGIVEPVNMVFVLEALFVLIILLSLTVIVSHLTERVYKLTQTMAILEKRIRDLENSNEK